MSSSEEVLADDRQENEEMSSEEEIDDEDEESGEDEDDIIQQGNNHQFSINGIELADIDFGTLAKAQKSLNTQTTSTTKSKSSRPHSQSTKQPPSDIPSKSNSRSKNAPQEISSKRPVSRKHFLTTIPTHSQHQPRDPRFETLTKSSSQDTFRKAYSFLEDYQRDEIALLKTQIRQSKDDAEREKLEKALQSLQSRKESREAKDRAQSVLKTKKRDEREKVKLGKRPFYLKKSTVLCKWWANLKVRRRNWCWRISIVNWGRRSWRKCWRRRGGRRKGRSCVGCLDSDSNPWKSEMMAA